MKNRKKVLEELSLIRRLTVGSSRKKAIRQSLNRIEELLKSEE